MDSASPEPRTTESISDGSPKQYSLSIRLRRSVPVQLLPRRILVSVRHISARRNHMRLLLAPHPHTKGVLEMDPLTHYLFGTEHRRICDRCPCAYWVIGPKRPLNMWWCRFCMAFINPPRTSDEARNKRRMYLRWVNISSV